jgi:transcriptional regulator with XRE-family HTH domain
MDSNVGEMIRKARHAKGLTQKQLAEQMNISDKAISKWECGLGNPSASLILRLSGLLEIDAKALLLGFEQIQEAQIKKSSTKRELKEEYKSRTVIGGIYRLTCHANGESWIRSTTDLQACKNRIEFSKVTKSCPESCVLSAWKEYGPDAFSFEVLEEITKGELQSSREFSEDVSTLLEIWKDNEGIYKPV